MIEVDRLRDRLPTFVAGASAGVLLAWLVRRREARSANGVAAAAPAGSGSPGTGTRGRWAEAFDGVLESLVSARERILGDSDPLIDLDALRQSLSGVAGSERVHLRDLGGGIVEALGSAPDADAVRQVLDTVRAGEGVAVVVNRIWTPSSATEGSADLWHSPRVPPDA